MTPLQDGPSRPSPSHLIFSSSAFFQTNKHHTQRLSVTGPEERAYVLQLAFASVNQAENSLSALSASSLIICIKNLLMRSPDALLLIRAPRRLLKRHKGLCSLRHLGRHACCIDLSILSLHLSFAFIARAALSQGTKDAPCGK